MALYRLTRSRIGIRVNGETIILNKGMVISMTEEHADQFGDRLVPLGKNEEYDPKETVDWLALVARTRKEKPAPKVEFRRGVPPTLADPPASSPASPAVPAPLSSEEQAIANYREQIADLNAADTIELMLKIEDPDALFAFRAAEVATHGRKTVLKAIDDRFEPEDK